MPGSTPLSLTGDPVVLAAGFLLLVWVLAEWTARNDADQIRQADGFSISREQGAIMVGFAALWIIFRGDNGDDE